MKLIWMRQGVMFVIVLLLPISVLAITPEQYVHRGRGSVNVSVIQQLKTYPCNVNLVQQNTPFKVGDAVYVEWHGNWYEATVLKVATNAKRYYIHYDSWSHSWDEWVGINRIMHRLCK